VKPPFADRLCDKGRTREAKGEDNMDKERIRRAVRDILEAIGEDPEREGLVDTPRRVADMYEEIFAGLHKDPLDEIRIFNEPACEEMVLVKDIPLHSMCEHHLLPFTGIAHVVYIPQGNRLLGLSKIARVVDTVSRKPQLQERLCSEIADTIMKAADPIGVAVVVEAEHLCMTMRGIKKAGARTVTSALRGRMRSDARTRAEAMALIQHGLR
jgi:GTP cyclohydrolase I